MLNRTPTVALLLCIAAVAVPERASAQDAQTPNRTVMHPRLMFAAADIPRLRQTAETGWIASARDRLQIQADKYLALKTDPYHFHGNVSARAAQVHILTLAFNAILTGDVRYARKGIEVITAFAAGTDPESMAALGGALAMGDAAHALCVGYDWLYPHLNGAQRHALLLEIEAFGTWLATHAQTDFWGRDERRRQAHNWAAVTHGGLGLAALTLGDRPEWLKRATYQVRRYVALSRDATGAPYEGMSYGAYGLQNAIPFAVALRRTTGTDLLQGMEGMLETPDHLLWHLVPWGGAIVPINQSSSTLKPAGAMMHLISRSQSRTGLWGWLRLLGPEGDTSYGWSSWLGDSVSLPYVILFADPDLQPRHPAEIPLPLSRHFERGQVAIRNGWEARSSLVTFTCGEGIPGVWNQGDEASFTFYALGEAFAVDAGAGKGSTSDHNAILINGKGQNSDGGPTAVQGRMTYAKDADDWCVVDGDATAAYSRRTGATRVLRRLVFLRRPHPCLIILDDVRHPQENSEVSWVMHSAKENRIELNQAGATITGGRTGATCRILAVHPRNPAITLGENPIRTGALKTLRFTARGNHVRFITVLLPMTGDTPRILKATTAGHDLSLRMAHNEATYDILVREHQVTIH